MTHPTARISIGLAAGLFGVALLAATPTGGAYRGGVKAFQEHSVPVDGLVLSFRDLVMNLFTIRVQNPTAGLLGFDPADLHIVDATGCHVRVLERLENQEGLIAATPFRVFPGAFAIRTYQVLDRWKAPYRIFHRDRLLAEISD